jgi:hypothetical protein
MALVLLPVDAQILIEALVGRRCVDVARTAAALTRQVLRALRFISRIACTTNPILRVKKTFFN